MLDRIINPAQPDVREIKGILFEGATPVFIPDININEPGPSRIIPAKCVADLMPHDRLTFLDLQGVRNYLSRNQYAAVIYQYNNWASRFAGVSVTVLEVNSKEGIAVTDGVNYTYDGKIVELDGQIEHNMAFPKRLCITDHWFECGYIAEVKRPTAVDTTFRKEMIDKVEKLKSCDGGIRRCY